MFRWSLLRSAVGSLRTAGRPPTNLTPEKETAIREAFQYYGLIWKYGILQGCRIYLFDKLEFVDYSGVPTSIKLPSKS